MQVIIMTGRRNSKLTCTDTKKNSKRPGCTATCPARCPKKCLVLCPTCKTFCRQYSDCASIAHSPNSGRSSHCNGISGQHKLLGNVSEHSDCSTHSLRITSPHDSELPNRRTRSSSDEMLTAGSRVDDNVSMDAMSLQSGEDGYKPRGTISLPSNQVQAEWIEQYEPGVYITLTTLRDGSRDLKRVRFSRRRFGEHQAENWWNENREKVYERYNVKSSDRVSSAASTRSAY